ncbi:MAG: hypothetical protein WBC93_06290 [Sulfitobacter sp.]
MSEYLIALPWPPRELSANSRKDRRHTTGKRAGYKQECWAATKALNAKISPDAHLEITFYPPDNRRRDLDNMLSSIKYGLDGVALAANVDDYGWSMSIERGPKKKGGGVLVHVKPAFVVMPIIGTIS